MGDARKRKNKITDIAHLKLTEHIDIITTGSPAIPNTQADTHLNLNYSRTFN